jgi:hypothetical protein
MRRKYEQIELPKWKFQILSAYVDSLMLQGTTKSHMVLRAPQS